MQMNYAGAAEVRRVIHDARREVILSMPSTGPVQGQVDIAAVHSVSGNAGVSVKIYVPAGSAGRGGGLDRGFAELLRQGVQVHTAAGGNPRMAIIDRSVVVLARNEEDYSDGALIGRSVPFTLLLARSLTMRPPADEQGEAFPADDDGLPPVSRGVLRQLALGAKDETAAREMGMALRTYRRGVAQLMETLDARSRFQAGFVAGQRGLLQ
ncbi:MULTISPECIES: hypothetical protein [unclassified Streptomyces]|uniref:hypothetical protein n=1 Tax=unclassified Streptomyces TaxID=2593676 RepID=UPI003644E96E